MGTKERREREREVVRGKILDAARAMFAAEGYDAVTMRRIAEEIEYSPTAIYLHFRDKEALLHEICSIDFLALAQGFAALSRVPDPVERLRLVGLGYARFAASHPQHYRLMFMTPKPEVAPEDTGITKGNPEEDAYAFLRLTIEQGIAAGCFRKGLTDSELLAQLLWAGVHGVVSLEIAKGCDAWVDWRPLEVRVATMVETLVGALTVPPGTASARGSAPARKSTPGAGGRQAAERPSSSVKTAGRPVRGAPDPGGARPVVPARSAKARARTKAALDSRAPVRKGSRRG